MNPNCEVAQAHSLRSHLKYQISSGLFAVALSEIDFIYDCRVNAIPITVFPNTESHDNNNNNVTAMITVPD